MLFARIGWRVDAMWDRIVVFLAFLAHHIDAARLTPRANTIGPSQHALRADNSDWMAEDASILRDMTLGEVVLPGTHDAGAYALTSKLMPAHIAVARCSRPTHEVMPRFATAIRPPGAAASARRAVTLTP